MTLTQILTDFIDNLFKGMDPGEQDDYTLANDND